MKARHTVPHCVHLDTGTTTPPQPFYGLFPETIWMSQCQKKASSGLYDVTEDNKRQTHQQSRWAPHHPANQQPTSINPKIPPFLRWMPFLPQPSQFILAWDRTA